MKMLIFPIQFYIENISNGFGAINSKEIYLKGNVYEFSVDYNATDELDILNIYKFLMVKNNLNKVWAY